MAFDVRKAVTGLTQTGINVHQHLVTRAQIHLFQLVQGPLRRFEHIVQITCIFVHVDQAG